MRRRKRNLKTYRYLKRRRTRLKAELVAARGGCCEACGYERLVSALEFHHRDARTKEFAIGDWSSSRERLWVEAAKCVLLCANCHREAHAGLLEISALSPRLSETLSTYLLTA